LKSNNYLVDCSVSGCDVAVYIAEAAQIQLTFEQRGRLPLWLLTCQ
jgi:hypothetical protein